MPWDPSVKSLTAFPAVLDNMARNHNWTGSLGNASVQPTGRRHERGAGDAPGTRSRRERCERRRKSVCMFPDGQILIAPVNPALVYVPYYDRGVSMAWDCAVGRLLRPASASETRIGAGHRFRGGHFGGVVCRLRVGLACLEP